MRIGADSDKTTAYLTHEMRTHLTVIIAALKLLHEKQKDSQDRVLTGMAIENAKKLNNLVDDILTAAKERDGGMNMDIRPCDPVQLTHDTAQVLEPWTRRDGIELKVRSQANCPEVLADPKRVAQALTNLISNALKFTPSNGSVEIVVERGRHEHTDYVIVSVSDSGTGIPAAEQACIFEEFIQGQHGRARGDGTGLGLPLARSLIERMGGWLWVESEPGAGSTFRFTLPAHVP